MLEHGDACLEELEAPPRLLLIAADSVELLVEGVDALGGDAEIRAERFVEHSRVSTGLFIAGADLGPKNLARLVNAGAEVGPENLARLNNAGADLGPETLPRFVVARVDLGSQAYQAPVDLLEGVAQLRIHRL